MCSNYRNECDVEIEMNKPFDNHKQIVENSWAILSMVAPIFYGMIVVVYVDVVDPIICITLIIFVKYLPQY